MPAHYEIFGLFRLIALLVLISAAACAGLPVRGSVGEQTIETRVDSEVARYYLANYLAGKRSDVALDERIDRLYRGAHNGLPDRGDLKRLSEEFSVDFAALYFADQIVRSPNNRKFRKAYNHSYEHARKLLAEGRVPEFGFSGNYEVVFVPGYLYKRHSLTGADLAAPRAALKGVGFPQHFLETVEDGTVEGNAEIVRAGIRARARAGRRLILVSVSKSGPEVALALTRLEPRITSRIAAWVNIVGILQGSPLADEDLLQMEEVVGRVDIDGVESLRTSRSRQRFKSFRIPENILVVNYIGIPLTGSISLLASSGFAQLRSLGPNDGLSLLADLIAPRGITLAELGRDHFLLGDEIDAATIGLTVTVIRYLEQSRPPRDGSS